VEWAENQTQVSRPFHRPLKIPQTRRDLHISTAPAMMVFTEPKTKERKSAAARPPHSSVPPSLRSGGPYFMLIFRLENAQRSYQSAAATLAAISAPMASDAVAAELQ